MNQETIDGFDIPKRQLTSEEANREITLERFNEWMVQVGEDFVDQVTYGSGVMLAGFCMGKHPEHSILFVEAYNEDRKLIPQDILHIYTHIWGFESGNDKFYTDYAEFANLTVFTKQNINQLLIQVMEHYGK